MITIHSVAKIHISTTELVAAIAALANITARVMFALLRDYK
jgi:hypothetical protein